MTTWFDSLTVNQQRQALDLLTKPLGRGALAYAGADEANAPFAAWLTVADWICRRPSRDAPSAAGAIGSRFGVHRQQPTKGPAMHLDATEAFTTTEGITFQPWNNGPAVGFRVTHPDGRTEYLYLNPSGEHDDPAAPSGPRATAFVYHGSAGDPAEDAPYHYYELFT